MLTARNVLRACRKSRPLCGGKRALQCRSGGFASRALSHVSGAARGSVLTVNQREYRMPTASQVSVAICLDGSAQEYIDSACRHGRMPHWERLLRVPGQNTTRGALGHWGLAAGVMPSLTNPNNMAIVTGVPPNVNGICGNYYFDTSTGQEVMMNDPAMLRADSILGALSHAGARVRVITAKDKLRKMLNHGLSKDTAICFSAEKENDMDAGTAAAVRALVPTRPEGLTQAPTIYDPNISIYMLKLGAQLVKGDYARMSKDPAAYPNGAVYYLSTTDYVQHKYAPEAPEALDFYGQVDEVIGELDALGATVGVTADHGMNDKTKFDGTPQVIFIESELRSHLAQFKGVDEKSVDVRVILPITDPYVVHHGALGGYATIYVSPTELADEARSFLRSRRGVYSCLSRFEAARAFDLPEDRIGDIVIVGDRETVFGRTPEFHDLSQVAHLRSHGSIDESRVPMFFNRRLQDEFAQRLTKGKARSFDLFDLLLNGMVH